MPTARTTGSGRRPRDIVRARIVRARINRGRKFSGRTGESLSKEVGALKELVGSLTARVAELEQEAAARRSLQLDDVIVIREISKEQARKEIIESLESGQPLDQADLADALSLEISLVVEVCNELIEEGVVVLHDDDRS